jgi:hypothetical protein
MAIATDVHHGLNVESKDKFKARYGTREEALEAIRVHTPVSKFHSHRGLIALGNPTLTDDDLFELEKHPHPQIALKAAMALNKRGFHRQSILAPNVWIRKK